MVRYKKYKLFWSFMGYIKFIQKMILILLMGLNCVSCATVINGTTQRVPVSSDPVGAYVFVDGNPVGCTPTQIELKRKYDHLITLSKEGYEDETIRVEPVLSAAVAGNIIAGGFIGWGVDAINGAQYRLIPETVHVKMRPGVPYCHSTPVQVPYMQ